MIEALLLKTVVVAKALLGLGKVPFLVLGVAAILALLLMLPVAGLAVLLSLVVGAPSSRARPIPR